MLTGHPAYPVCHKPHEGQDFVMSLASFSGTTPGAAQKPSGPGTYGYICGLHPGMKGQIEVTK